MSIPLATLPAAVVACMRDEDRRALGLPVRRPAPVPGGGGKAGVREAQSLEHGAQSIAGESSAGEREGGRQPNKTEARYRAERLRGCDARYEALTFRLRCGHRYTPDWVVFGGGGGIECHEVKGAYRFGSHGRARLAFDQAKAEFPGFLWVWATYKGGRWEVGS